MMKSISHSVVSNSLQPNGLQSTRLLCPWDFQGKNTGVGWHFLLQGIFLTQGSNPGLPHCRQILYRQCHLVREERIASKTCYRKLKEPHLLLCVCAQSCLTLLWPHGRRPPPSSSVHRIFQARKLEWIAIFFSRSHSVKHIQSSQFFLSISCG